MSNNINELARQERNRYAREWRARNKDKVRINNQKYWERRAQKAKEQGVKKSGKD